MLCYDRFDQIDDSDDEGEVVASKASGVDTQRKMQLLAQHDAMFLLVGWLSKAAPKLNPTETTRLVRFVATNDKVANDDREKRLEGLIEFMRTEGREGKLDRTALIALCHFANDRVSASEGKANERLAASRVLILAMSALNALDACKDEGGAAALVEKLNSDPALNTRFEEFEYAKAAVRACNAPDEAEEEEEVARIKELAGGEDGADDEMSPEEEAKLMREAMATAQRNAKEAKQQAALQHKLRRPAWQGVLRQMAWHLGIVGLAYLGRLAYEHYMSRDLLVIDEREL